MLIPLLSNQDDVIVTFPILEPWSVPNSPNDLNGLHPWTQYIGANSWGVDSGGIKLENSGSIAHGGRMDVHLGTNDYKVQAAVTEFTHSGVNALVASICSRMQGDESVTFYAFDLLAFSGAFSLLLLKFLAGQTSLSSVPLPSAPVGIHNIGMQVTGESPVVLKCFYDGVQVIEYSDNSSPISSGPFVGIQGVANGVGNRTRMDDFLVSLPVSAFVRRHRGFQPFIGVR